MNHIQQIITLQNIDSQLQEIAELLGDLPKKVEDLKKKLEDQESIEKAYNNYIYEGNPFDMVQESSEDFTEDQPVEFEARHHKLLATKAALKNARGAGITVAVTDTGVAYDHTDLVDNIWMNEAENPLFSNKLRV